MKTYRKRYAKEVFRPSEVGLTLKELGAGPSRQCDGALRSQRRGLFHAIWSQFRANLSGVEWISKGSEAFYDYTYRS